MRFSAKLKEALEARDMKPADLHRLTGINNSSISQYLSGYNEPNRARKELIIKALGLDNDYFEKKAEPSINLTLNLDRKDAARILGGSVGFVEGGLQQGLFPWGYAVKRGEWRYFINIRRFIEHEKISPEEAGLISELSL